MFLWSTGARLADGGLQRGPLGCVDKLPSLATECEDLDGQWLCRLGGIALIPFKERQPLRRAMVAYAQIRFQEMGEVERQAIEARHFGIVSLTPLQW